MKQAQAPKDNKQLEIVSRGALHLGRFVAVGAAVLGLLCIRVSAQISPQRVNSLARHAEGGFVLTVAGRGPTTTARYSLYPIEGSTDLIHWHFIATLLRTNANTAPLPFRHQPDSAARQFFYRTASNNLTTPFRR